MTAPAVTLTLDPTGLAGELLVGKAERNFRSELWAYPSRLTLAELRAAWLAYYPIRRHLTSVHEERVANGRRIVRVDRTMIPPDPHPHVDEPPL